MSGIRRLERNLGALFKPQAPRRPDPQRQAREAAKRLATEHGVEIERLRDGGMNVWPPKGYRLADPFDGDHHAQDWGEALCMVKAYAGLLPNEAAAVDDEGGAP